MTVTRFAPSPTGHLHKGHAYSALEAYSLAKKTDGLFLLRIEDIDHTRCNEENTRQILEDLAWLGIEWEEPIRIQSQHLDDYTERAAELERGGFLYPCFCTRREIQEEIERAGHAPHGSEGPLYPGTCRRLSSDERASRIAGGDPYALRLNLAAALEKTGPLTWHDAIRGPQAASPELLGDAVIIRKDIGTSYHLAVTVDDAIQNVTDIVRGVDLFDSTHLHRVLQELLQLPVPTYHHHDLLTDEDGNRLAKRDRSITLKQLRESGITAGELKADLKLPTKN